MLIVANKIQKCKVEAPPPLPYSKIQGHWQGFLGAEIVEWILSDCSENRFSFVQ